MERTIDRIYNKVDTIFVGSFLVIIFILLSFLLFVWSFFANLFVPVLFMVIITLIVIKFTWVDILYYNLRNARIEVSELEDMIRLDEREKLNNIEGLFVKIESVNRIISNIKSSSIFNLIDWKIWGRIQKLLYDLDSRLKISMIWRKIWNFISNPKKIFYSVEIIMSPRYFRIWKIGRIKKY